MPSQAPAPPPAAEPDQANPCSTSYPTDGPLRLRATCRGHAKAVSRVRFAPSGRLLASVSADATLQLWRVPDGRAVLGTTRSPPAQQQKQQQKKKRRSSSGAAADDTSGDGAPPSEQQEQEPAQLVMRHDAGINDVDWNTDGSYLATASDDLSARLWDAETGACLTTLLGHTNYVFCCQFNPPGNILATGSFDETVRFWDVRSGRCLRELPAHSDPVTALDFSYDGSVLASCSFDGLLRLWDTATGHCLKTLAIDNGEHPLGCVTFSPNGAYLLQSCLNSKMRLVAYEGGVIAKTYKGHANTKFCSVSCFLPSGLPSGQQQQQQQRACVASGSEDGSIFVWDVNSKQVVQQLPGRSSPEDEGPGHCGPVLCVAAHASQPTLASAGHEPDCTVKIWSALGPGGDDDGGDGDVAMAEA